MIMMIKTLGLFDSGLGGYTVFHELRNAYPQLSLVLYADQKNAPYGNYEKDQIINLANDAMQWFLDQGITDVFLACNTVTSCALPLLKEKFPMMNIWGIIDITVSQLPETLEHVGVVATRATVESHAYLNAFNATYTGIMTEVALPTLVGAIESLQTDDIVKEIIGSEIGALRDCSHILLGCTHFPLVKHIFESESDAIVLDSIKPTLDFVKDQFHENENANHLIYTSGDAANMASQIMTLYGEVEEVIQA